MDEVKIRKKIIYEDGSQRKVIRGYIISEEEHLYKIQGSNLNDIVTIGKRAVIKVSDDFGGEHNE